jgi:hypothetical protein
VLTLHLVSGYGKYNIASRAAVFFLRSCPTRPNLPTYPHQAAPAACSRLSAGSWTTASNSPPRSETAPPPTTHATLVRLYGTSDITLILARIAQGLLRARYLEEKIASIAVLADICRDLGIPPSHELWDELYRVIKEYGGNSSRLYFDWLEQAFPIRHILARFKATPEARPEPAGTGPPLAIPA